LGVLFSGDSGDFRVRGGEIFSPRRDYMLRGFAFGVVYSERKPRKHDFRKKPLFFQKI
jgi:hypothetical protein